MKNWFWWVWFKSLFNSPVPEPKRSSHQERLVTEYYEDRYKRIVDNETEARKNLHECLCNNYKEQFTKTPMFLIGHRPNPHYLRLLAAGYPDLTTSKITELFYKISEELELVELAYLETPGVVDIPTPVYDDVLANYRVQISFMGDVYPTPHSAAYLIKMYGMLTVMSAEEKQR